ncbi:ATP-binding protein [uncultured Clostridium sp.]|uniref:hybrid sensor histidine kinase/response regulator n=1 Tax=uncultured Clostridium sp. TaxID=59620 RepID=UPI0028E419F1|nr:ATP-binding protein [uncultured Clostridium sp.]
MKNILRSIIVLGMLLVSFFISFYDLIPNKNPLLAEKGKMDLSQWDFYENRAVKLDGEWELYDNQLLTPDDFHKEGLNKPKLTGYTKLTSTRTDDKNDNIIEPKGVRSYRLVMKINPSDEVFGLKVENIKMSNKVYVNGSLKGSSGNPDEKNKGYYPKNIPYDTYFNIQGDKVEIIMQMANFDYPFRGTLYKIYFGFQKDISFMTMTNFSIELAGAILAFLFGIYCLNIYSMSNGEKVYLYSGINLLATMISLTLNGQKSLLQLFPGISFELFCKVQEIAIILMVISLLRIIKEVDKRILPKPTIKITNIVSTIYILIVLIAKYSIHVYLNLIMSIFIPILLITVILRLIIMTLKNSYGTLGRKGNIIFLKSTICIFICVTNNFLYSFKLVHTKLIGSVALCGFMILMAIIMSYKFSLTYKDMEKMSSELIEMYKVKDEFITKTSYELKAPLYGIINIAETIIKENSDSLKDKNIKDIIITKNIALRLCNIINDTLDVTLLKNNQLKINISTIDIKICTNLVIESYKYIIQNKNINIINNIKESLMVKGDKDRVRQILFNLINNAVKNMEKGTIKISSNKINDMVYVSVEDTGIGIPIDKQEKIFEPYESLNSEGIGLGLYITRQLVELMEGKIYLEWSEINKGSCFVFSLLYSEEASNLCEVSNIEDMKYFQKLSSIDYPKTKDRKKGENTILIVDYELLNIQTALNIFHREGYNVLTAFSGEEALNKIKDNKVDLILLDVMMPGISGIDICKKIREKYSIIELPILISTLRNTNCDLFLGFEAGANDFITKPFEEKEIIGRVRTLIELKKSMEHALKSELAFLQAQIKPHFLYNALSTIISFCYTDSQKAANLLMNFSKYLRLAFDIDNKLMIVPLRRELEMVDAYVEIEKARFGEKIKIEYDIEQELMSEEIPSLSIQPLVENAIKHGLCEKSEGGTVYVSAKKKRGTIYITVRDTGVGMSMEKIEELENIDIKNEGIGFSNISKRIRRLNKAEINICSIEGEGTTVTISIKNL